ncbi:MAG TPA: O-antigen ligase family protein [Anaeromyxobacteraceae bacterium]|jgi:O-antigen ligase|nr:O-antigen ligase family protein [Anaeromyxobacteraceae bacterium]
MPFAQVEAAGLAFAPGGERLASRAGARWGALAFAGALLFMAQLYASPAYWFPSVEALRLGLLAAVVCAGAVLARRVLTGERLRLGGPPALLLFGYAAIAGLSVLWSIQRPATVAAVAEIAKLLVIYLALLNALDTPRRLRAFVAVGAVASLAPALGGIRVWLANDHLVDGTRTHWAGIYADPNRLAMGLVVALPFAISALAATRRPWLRALLALAVPAQLAAIVLTGSRSGIVATALALALVLLRGRRSAVLKGLVVAAVLVAGVAAFAPRTFWQRSSTIADLSADASVEGRQNAWRVLGAIFEQRPFTGVGAGGFVHAWDRYAPLSAGGHHLVAHNVFMEILGELGLLALLAFFGFAAAALWRTWRAGGDPVVGREARAVFAALAGYLVCELVNGYSYSYTLYLLFAAGLALARLSRLHARMSADGGLA